LSQKKQKKNLAKLCGTTSRDFAVKRANSLFEQISISEMRIDHGPGYRIYFVKRRNEYILLLTGGDKASQQKDIAKAKRLATQL
jgi:putative addiction module killer protein